MADNQADRLRRTIEAPNGARVVMPVGTRDSKLLDLMLKWAYEPVYRAEYAAALAVETPFKAIFEKPARTRHRAERIYRFTVDKPYGLEEAQSSVVLKTFTVSVPLR